MICLLSQYSMAGEEYLMVGKNLSYSFSFSGRLNYFSVRSSNKDVVEATYSDSQKGSYPNYSYSYSVKLVGLKTGVSTVTISYAYHKAYSSSVNPVTVERTYYVTVVDVTGVSIPSTLSVAIGNTYTFSPQISHPNATTTLTWQSNNTSVATVNSNGVMSAIGVGTATIYCTAHNGVSAQCVVTVNPVLATSVTLSSSSAELTTGETMQLTATVSPSNTTDKSVTWSSTNTAVATVDGDGKVTATGSGQCNIVATTADGSSKTATCQITVPANVLYANNAVGVPSGTLTLPVWLKNESPITGLQFELQLPEGVSVAKDSNGKFTATLSDRAQDQSISVSQLSNGNYQFVAFSASSSALTGSEGAIAYITLNVGEEMTTGEYSIGIKDVELTTTDGASLHHKDMTSKLTLTEAIVGDTNGDGRVTVSDAVGVVNHVLHRTPSVFITKAADVNGDGKITVSDAVSIVNIIMNK